MITFANLLPACQDNSFVYICSLVFLFAEKESRERYESSDRYPRHILKIRYLIPLLNYGGLGTKADDRFFTLGTLTLL